MIWNIFQTGRMSSDKTEFINCPSCTYKTPKKIVEKHGSCYMCQRKNVVSTEKECSICENDTYEKHMIRDTCCECHLNIQDAEFVCQCGRRYQNLWELGRTEDYYCRWKYLIDLQDKVSSLQKLNAELQQTLHNTIAGYASLAIASRTK